MWFIWYLRFKSDRCQWRVDLLWSSETVIGLNKSWMTGISCCIILWDLSSRLIKNIPKARTF